MGRGVSGFEARLAPLNGYDFDPDAMVALRDDRTKIFFICNPNNPTGTYWNDTVFSSIHERGRAQRDRGSRRSLRRICGSDRFSDGIAMTQEYPNLVVFRTFSKMLRTGGIEVGYLVGSIELVNLMRRTCVVYSGQRFGSGGAVAALLDRQHVDDTRRVVAESRAYLSAELDKLGLVHQAGVANYVMVKLPMSDTIAYKRLMSLGYMVRSMTGFRYPNHIRISLAARPIMEGLVEALSQVLEGST